jgi:hypothetical protein
MALCPSGHDSQTSDYCDTCGAVIGGSPIAAAPGASIGPAVSSLPPTAVTAVEPGRACPQCGVARDGRFCEECGYDYELAELVPAGVIAEPAQGVVSSTAVESRLEPDPAEQTAALDPIELQLLLAEEDAAAEHSEPDAPQSQPEPQSELRPEPWSEPEPQSELEQEAGQGFEPVTTSGALIAIVVADIDYYQAQVERGDIVAADFPFPKYAGERRFELSGERLRIGRASSSRGLVVEIDLTGPPLDPAVSHLHAQLLRRPGGDWAVVDLNSANGTRINGGVDPIPAETEVPIKAGDRIQLGGWTTITVEQA